MKNSRPEVFIIESNSWRDEEDNRREGVALREMLALSEKRCKYVYLRTRREFRIALEQFTSSRYRYLHLACHGDGHGLHLTIDYLPFSMCTHF